MEYAGSYALFNYRLVDPTKGLEYDNLRLIRAFEHGLDPKSSEAGFVLVHVGKCNTQFPAFYLPGRDRANIFHLDMVRNSGPLVDGVVSALDGCAASDREAFNIGMDKVVTSMVKVNKVMDGM